MPASKMLPYYAEHFASTEINYTFRRTPAEKTILAWSSATPARFKFAFKAPQSVTHFAKLDGCAEILAVFQMAISKAGEKLGPVLFQSPPIFKKDVDVLRAFLADVSNGMRAAFEFRHESWFDDAVFETLRNGKAVPCIAENEKLGTPNVVTADFGYLRLRREGYTPPQIKRWSKWIGEQCSHWPEVCVYFKHEDQAVGPRFAKHMLAES